MLRNTKANILAVKRRDPVIFKNVMKKVHVRYPPRQPWFGSSLHGPKFKNFVMPKLAESNDDKNVRINHLGLSKTLFLPYVKSHPIIIKIMTCGVASIKHSM